MRLSDGVNSPIARGAGLSPALPAGGRRRGSLRRDRDAHDRRHLLPWPGLSEQAQYIAKLYGADDYVITEMEAAAITLVIKRLHGDDRVMSLRGAVNYDQGNPTKRPRSTSIRRRARPPAVSPRRSRTSRRWVRRWLTTSCPSGRHGRRVPALSEHGGACSLHHRRAQLARWVTLLAELPLGCEPVPQVATVHFE